MHLRIVQISSALIDSIQVLRLRVSRKAHLDLSGDLPNFLESTSNIKRDPSWRVLPVPPRLQKRHVDIGDLAPCDTQRFIKALLSPAQGIQVTNLPFAFPHTRWALAWLESATSLMSPFKLWLVLYMYCLLFYLSVDILCANFNLQSTPSKFHSGTKWQESMACALLWQFHDALHCIL